jgi:hypothetical protein
VGAKLDGLSLAINFWRNGRRGRTRRFAPRRQVPSRQVKASRRFLSSRYLAFFIHELGELSDNLPKYKDKINSFKTGFLAPAGKPVPPSFLKPGELFELELAKAGGAALSRPTGYGLQLSFCMDRVKCLIEIGQVIRGGETPPLRFTRPRFFRRRPSRAGAKIGVPKCNLGTRGINSFKAGVFVQAGKPVPPRFLKPGELFGLELPKAGGASLSRPTGFREGQIRPIGKKTGPVFFGLCRMTHPDMAIRYVTFQYFLLILIMARYLFSKKAFSITSQH